MTRAEPPVHVLDLLLQRQGARSIGTQLYPPRNFGSIGVPLPEHATELIGTVTGPAFPVTISRMGGLFVRVPDGLTSMMMAPASPQAFAAYEQFLDSAAASINLVLCELAFEGVVSAPASRVELGPAQELAGHAIVIAAGGGREIYTARTVDMVTAVIRTSWPLWSAIDPAVLGRIEGAPRAATLAAISGTMPLLVVGAYSNFSRHQLAEAIVDAWIVNEQLLDAMWHDYTATLAPPERVQRLHDQRTYSAAIRIEILQTAGALDDDAAALLNNARRRRNELAHRSILSLPAAEEALHSMQVMLERRLGLAVAAPSVAKGLSF